MGIEDGESSVGRSAGRSYTSGGVALLLEGATGVKDPLHHERRLARVTTEPRSGRVRAAMSDLPRIDAEPERVLARPTVVLVVDDEEAALAVIPEALRDGLEDLGWRSLVIETASSGEEAIEVATARGELHLLVTDVIMPGIDGIETTARLRALFPELATVVMTAHAPQHTTPIRALRLGAADYVTKPVSPDYLVETCHRQLLLHHLRRERDESRTLLESLLDSTDAGVLCVRGEELLAINAAATALLGPLSTGHGVKERLRELGLDAALHTDGQQRSNIEVRLPADPESGRAAKVIAVASNTVTTRSGRRLGDVLVLRDVTSLLEQRSVESFKKMAAIAAHEMKNSVTGLGLITQHLVARLEAGHIDPQETGQMAQIILDTVGRLDRFARSFLDFSRVPDPALLRAEPNGIVVEALGLYGERRGLPDWVQLVTRLGDGLPQVWADRDLLFQVIQNLVLNAVDAMQSRGRGTITLETGAGELGGSPAVRIAVHDDGEGIPPQLLERIFEPNVTTREAGTGLGLVIVRDIVHKHGGTVRVRSQRGHGATFEVLLPAAS